MFGTIVAVLFAAIGAVPPAGGFTSVHNHSVLLTGRVQQYCDMACGSAGKHTMCNPVRAMVAHVH